MGIFAGKQLSQSSSRPAQCSPPISLGHRGFVPPSLPYRSTGLPFRSAATRQQLTYAAGQPVWSCMASLSAFTGRAGGVESRGSCRGPSRSKSILEHSFWSHQSRTVPDRLIEEFGLKRFITPRKVKMRAMHLPITRAISEDRKSGIIAITVDDHNPNARQRWHKRMSPNWTV